MIGFGAEILFEIVFELVPSVIELVLEAVSWLLDPSDERRSKRSAKRERASSGRGRRTSPVLIGGLMIVSLFGGLWWGRYVLSTGQAYPPLTLWSLIIVGGAAAIFALTIEERSRDDGEPESSRLRRYLQFDRDRLTRLALLNLAGAVGVALGYYV